MGSADAYYARIEAEKEHTKAEDVCREISEYNRELALIKEISGEIIKKADANPPKTFYWMSLGKEKVIAYCIFRSRYVSACLLSDGGIALCESGFNLSKILEFFNLDPISDFRELSEKSFMVLYKKELIRDMAKALCDDTLLQSFGIKRKKQWIPFLEYSQEKKNAESDYQEFIAKGGKTRRKVNRRFAVREGFNFLRVGIFAVAIMAIICIILMISYNASNI